METTSGLLVFMQGVIPLPDAQFLNDKYISIVLLFELHTLKLLLFLLLYAVV